MKRFATATALLALLAACDDEQPLNFGDTEPVVEAPEETPTVTTIEEIVEDEILNPDNLPDVNGVFGPVAGDVKEAAFDASAETFQVSVSFDGDNPLQTYTRDAQYDVPGYIAFTTQDDVLDRFFTAFVAESEDNNSFSALVVDGGQFNRYFGGVAYEASGFTPAVGLVSYAGTYVGLTNIGTDDGIPDTNASDDLLPRRSTRVTGDIFINADFADNVINGEIYNRGNADVSPLAPTNLVLTSTTIESDGTFEGAVENRAQDGLGSYSGAFGGNQASSLVGGVYLSEVDPNLEQEEERGTFVLNQCGTPGEAAQCGLSNVDDSGED